ncbi:MAG: undecaprenyl/decaprenyl-phosphate alpha-N-acetylglucosaminyl 1-phosphate transferase [Syntrophorhabdaceae bacterium]|nr:undecaprenyl/decaprenyl-phosphate alpha-N-acetylglucosaminyl 1-phosphate transferase [Syntrophorhabdaceae bacterium]
MMIYLSTLLLTLLVTIVLVPITIKVSEMIQKYDMPGRRKVHTVPVPRTGGIAMAVAVFSSMLLWAQESSLLSAYVMSAGIIVVFGLIDDFVDLPYRYKFAGQFLAALVIVVVGDVQIRSLGTLFPGSNQLSLWISIPLTIIVIVGVTNAINLADGLDGLAGGICILSFCCTGYIAYLSNNTDISLLAVALVGSIFGFLKYNTHPASVFMGDTGSQFLGFSLVTTTISLTQSAAGLSPLLPMIIFGFPVLDTGVVMLERIGAGRSPFKPDKNHFHHKLIRIGLVHKEAVFVIYLLQALLVVSAFVFRYYSDWFLLISYGIFVDVVIIGFFAAEITRWKAKRYTFLDKHIKGKLAKIKNRGVWIIFSFKIIEYGIPLLLFVTTLLPTTVPGYFSYIAAGLLILTTVIAFVKKKWLKWFLMADLYVVIPLIVFFSTQSAYPFVTQSMMWAYNCAFIVLVFFVIMTLRLTRRRSGFKVTPMDFLIVFVAIIAPFVSGVYGQHKQVTFVAAKTVMLFFSFEVLIGELRGEYKRLVVFTMCSLAVIIVRGLM